MFEMINIFDVFLPQLLMYPNPADPLNPEAAGLMLKDPSRYEKKVKEYVAKYAKPQPSIDDTAAGTTEKAVEKPKESDIDGEILDDIEDGISLGEVSDLSETSDISLIE